VIETLLAASDSAVRNGMGIENAKELHFSGIGS
jgi:hypothetical protein